VYWFPAAARRVQRAGKLVSYVCMLCMCMSEVGVLAGARPPGLSIIIIGVQAPRRIRSH